MTSPTHWQATNQRYLGAALRWLRLRLEQAAAETGSSADAAAETGRSADPDMTDAEVTAVRAEMMEAERGDPPSAAIILRQVLGLSSFEVDVLLLCAGMELDSRIAGLCARVQPESNRPYPTFALALTLFSDAAWDALSPERPLRRWRLIEINQAYGQPFTTSALRADERIVSYLKGLNYLDDRLTPLLFPVRAGDNPTALPASQQSVVDSVIGCLQMGAEAQQLPVFQLVGPDTVSKQLIASQVAAALGLDLYRLPVDLLPAQASELETLARLWQRESALLPIAMYLDTLEADKAHDAHGAVLDRFLARSVGIVFVDAREARPSPNRTTQVFDVAKPTPQEQQVAWSRQLGAPNNGLAGRLAEQFDLNLGTIHHISQSARLGSPAGDGSQRVWDACLAQTRPRLNTLAQRIEPKATWNDLVLPSTEVKLLRQITAQVGHRAQVYDQWGFRHRMSRGLGITALFAGPSGTGKTMAAEVLAHGLRLNLYRIDLSAVVSKYIGETEKNLSRLFDAAEDGGAILFFDEADALFGKRSEVKDSHDRYANIEVNYLLQRMESFRGLAILATNMKSALDQAFMRRLRFVVSFLFPGVPERKAIWDKVFPAETEKAELDYDKLAAFALTGGSIHSVALNAAFLAAQARQPVTMSVVFEALRSELRKLEQPIHESDFRYSGPVAPIAVS